MNKFLNVTQGICYFLIVLGALNWGLVGAFNFNLVSFFFNEGSFITRSLYILIGAAAVISAVLAAKCTMDTSEEF